MASPDLQPILADLVSSVPGSGGAIVLDADGAAVAQVPAVLPTDMSTISAHCSALLQETLAAAERLRQGPVTDILLEAERASLALIPLGSGGCLCLLLQPDASAGRGLYEARRAALRLNDLR